MRPLVSLIIPALFFAAIAPTLSWQDFSSGSENLVVGTVLEMHREGEWIVPTLQGRPRIAKPPLAAWTGGLAASSETLDQLSSADPAVRYAAYTRLAWQVRWPALALACLALVAVYAMAQTLAGPRTGWIAAAIAGSTVFFLRYARIATTDVQLLAWVAIANALLAAIIFERRALLWIPLGAALGLAFMSKGPVGLLQTVVPAAVFALWPGRARSAFQIGGRCPCATGPIVLGAGLFLLVAVPWFVLAAWASPEAPQRWLSEALRSRSTGTSSDSIASYLIFIPEFLPWTVFLLAAGVGLLSRQEFQGDSAAPDRRRRLLFAALLLLVPVVVMTIFRDRKDRYLLPMIAPAAVLTAFAVRQFIDHKLPVRSLRALAMSHWLMVALLAVVLPLAGAVRIAGQGPWLSWPVALLLAGGSAALIGPAIAMRRRWPAAIVPATAGIMLILAAGFMRIYAAGPEGRSDMKPLADLILARVPDPTVFYVRPDGKDKMAPLDLAIYLNRTVPTAAHEPASATVSIRVQRRVQGSLEPEPQLPGWDKLAQVPRDGDFLHVFVRNRPTLPATSPSPAPSPRPPAASTSPGS